MSETKPMSANEWATLREMALRPNHPYHWRKASCQKLAARGYAIATSTLRESPYKITQAGLAALSEAAGRPS